MCCQRARCLTVPTAHCQHGRPPVHAGDGGEVREQLVRVRRSHAVVELGHLVEHPTEVASIRSCHCTILPLAALGIAGTSALNRHAEHRHLWPAPTPDRRLSKRSPRLFLSPSAMLLIDVARFPTRTCPARPICWRSQSRRPGGLSI